MSALTELLDRLTKLHEEATPAPWRFDCGNLRVEAICRQPVCDISTYSDIYGRCGEIKEYEDNAELIAASRNALPLLLQIVKIQQEALEKISISDLPLDEEHEKVPSSYFAERTLKAAERIAGSEFKWTTVDTKEAIEAFYLSILPKIKEAARECGYAIGVHGSLRRDLDLIAIPWIEASADKERLVRSVHRAACGLEMQNYSWEKKPMGRMATCFPVCFPTWNEPSLGHIDLSVVEGGKP